MGSNGRLGQNDALTEKLIQIVLDNLQNEQFGVSELAKIAGISRSHLHRKLILIRNQSVSQFIREIRLKQAHNILKVKDVTVSEVAYEVGFSNPSYFNKCFHDYYGFPPGEVKNNILNEKVLESNNNKFPAKGANRILSGFYSLISGSTKMKLLPVILLVVILGLGYAIILNKIYESKKQLDTRNIESVLVLPFKNYTGDNGLEYFVSGMHSSLIGDMGKLSGIRVISATSSRAYKNVGISIKEMASELNVDAVVETSVTCLGDSICVQFNLFSVYPEEQQIWVGDFKEERSRILNLYSNTTKKIANEIQVNITPFEETLLSDKEPVDTSAYNAYLRGLYNLDKINKHSLDSAEIYFNIAREKVPDWSLAYSGLAKVWVYNNQMGFVSSSVAVPKIYTNLNAALQLDPNSSESHYLKAVIAVWTEWNWEKGEEEFRKSIELNPNHALCRTFYSHYLMIMNREEEALKQAKKARELDPLQPFILAMYAKVLMNYEDYETASLQIEKALKIDSNHYMGTNALQQFCKVTGDYERWFKVWKKRNSWMDSITIASIEKTFYEKGYLATIEKIINLNEEVEKSGGRIAYHGQAMAYLQLNKYKKAIEYLYKSYNEHNPNLPYASTRRYDSHILKDYPEFIELMEKMNLPIDML